MNRHQHINHLQAIDRAIYTMPPSIEPVCLDDFEVLAKRTLSESVFGYFVSGADGEQTVELNKSAYSK